VTRRALAPVRCDPLFPYALPSARGAARAGDRRSARGRSPA
jgi:hypothetical protein